MILWIQSGLNNHQHYGPFMGFVYSVSPAPPRTAFPSPTGVIFFKVGNQSVVLV